MEENWVGDSPVPYSNSAARAVAIIEFLASRPAQTFSLSEIARRCGIRKSTAYNILSELQARGWLTRWPSDLRYGLGPALILIGRAAGEVQPEVHLARPILEDLSAEFRCEVVFTTPVADQILVLESTGPVGLRPSALRRGGHSPLVAPLGAVFVAWQGDDARRAWYVRSGLNDPDRFEEMDRLLADIAARGYVVTIQSDFQAHLSEVVKVMSQDRDLTAQELLAALKERLTSLSTIAYLGGGEGWSAERQVVESLQAPVFAADGEARYAVGVANIDREYDRASLARAGERVRRAADVISAAISAHGAG